MEKVTGIICDSDVNVLKIDIPVEAREKYTTYKIVGNISSSKTDWLYFCTNSISAGAFYRPRLQIYDMQKNNPFTSFLASDLTGKKYWFNLDGSVPPKENVEYIEFHTQDATTLFLSGTHVEIYGSRLRLYVDD